MITTITNAQGIKKEIVEKGENILVFSGEKEILNFVADKRVAVYTHPDNTVNKGTKEEIASVVSLQIIKVK